MCGRAGYSIPRGDLLAGYPWLRDAPEAPARYNIAPTDPVLAVTAEGAREVRWGIEGAPGGLFNLRSETVLERPQHAARLRGARAIVPFSHFYEWRREGRRRLPFALRRRDGGILHRAGLLGAWEGRPAVTILTVAASSDLDGLHDRMPVILDGDGAAAWALEELSDRRLADLLRPAEPGTLVSAPASPLVNSVRNQGAELLDPERLPDAYQLGLELDAPG